MERQIVLHCSTHSSWFPTESCKRRLTSLGKIEPVQVATGGNYDEAERLYRRCEKIVRNSFGTQHAHYGATMHSLGTLFWLQGKHAEALEHLQSGLKIRKAALGPTHPDVAQSLSVIAEVHGALNNLDEVKSNYLQSLHIYREAGHPQMTGVMIDLADIARTEGRFEHAEELLDEALAIRREIYGPVHHKIARALGDLGFLHDAQGRFSSAEKIMKQSIAMYEEVLGPEHLHRAVILGNLVGTLRAQDKHLEAIATIREVLQIKEANHGLRSRRLVGTISALASSLEALDFPNANAEARRLRTRAAEIAAGPALNALAPSPEAIQRDVRSLAAATYGGDPQTVLRLVNPRVVQLLGGSAAAGRKLTEASAGFRLESISFPSEPDIVEGGENQFVVVRARLVVVADGEPVSRDRHYLGIRDTNTFRWTYFDGSLIDRETVQELLPGFPTEYELPKAHGKGWKWRTVAGGMLEVPRIAAMPRSPSVAPGQARSRPRPWHSKR